MATDNLPIYKQITIEDIEKLLKLHPELEYPKYYGEGLYEISKGCFTGEKGLELFEYELTKQLKDFYYVGYSKNTK